MKKLFGILLCCITSATSAQFTGGIGGGGFTACTGSFTLLPVELLYFTAMPEGDGVVLNWATATELNNAGFQVERSGDGERFETIIRMPGMGTTQQVTEYKELDRDPLPGLSYYRLRQTDIDGTETWSNTVAVQWEQDVPVAYPNPVHDVVTIAGIGPDAVVEVLDPIGRLLRVERSTGEHFTLETIAWPAGRYTARIIEGNNVRTISLIKD